MSGSRELTQDVDIDIAGLFAELWRKKLLLLAVVGITAAALYSVFSGTEPRFRSNARILIENRESVFTRPQEGASGSVASTFDEQAIGSQVQVIGSDEIALAVIDRLQLVRNEEFVGEAAPSLIGDVLTVLGLANSQDSIPSRERILSAFRERLTVYAPEQSRVIVVDFWAHDAELARDVSNAVAEEYLAFNKEAKRLSTEEATDWLGPEIDELRNRLRDAEAKVADYRANSDILIGANNSLLATQQLSEASSELSRIRAERSQAEGKVASIRDALGSGGSLDVIPEVIASPLIQRLREREVELQAQISELSTTLLPNHPRLKALQSQRSDFRNQIRGAARDILTSLENNVNLFTRQEEVLVKRINQLKAEVARVNEAEVELRALEREAAAQRQLLESYLTQYREAASRQNREYLPVDAKIISRAVLPVKPYYPKVVPFTIAGTTAVAILMVVAILAWALMTGKAYKPVGRVAPGMVPDRLEPSRESDSVEYSANPESGYRTEPGQLPSEAAPAAPDLSPAEPDVARAPAGSAPSAAPPLYVEESGPVDPPADAANDDASFPFRYAFEAILALGHARIAMIAPGGDNGSLSAWYLARSLAHSGKAVIIVDLTGSAVTSRRFLGSDNVAGLRDMLAGSAAFEDSIYNDRHSPAHVLPVGREQAEDPVNSIQQLSRIAGVLDDAYDFIVFDCGCAAPDGLASIADGETLVLISHEGAGDKEAIDCEKHFRDAGYDDAVIIRLEPNDRERALADAA